MEGFVARLRATHDCARASAAGIAKIAPDHGRLLARRCCPCSRRSRKSFAVYDRGTAPCRRRRSATGRSSTPRPRTASSRTARRRLREVARRPGGAHGLQPPRGAGTRLAHLLRRSSSSSRSPGVLHAPALEKYWRTEHFATMEQFYDDVENGTLPAYAFIEPRMVYNHNDFHPPFGELRESDVDGAEVDRQRGLRRARRRGARRTTSTRPIRQSATTRLERDEHDAAHHLRRARRHLRPRAAARRDAADRRREAPARWDSHSTGSACRVPAIADLGVHPRRARSSTTRCTTDRVIATLASCTGSKPLTERDDGAPDLFNAVNLEHAAASGRPGRPPTPQYMPPNPESANAASGQREHATSRSSPPARGLLGHAAGEVRRARLGDRQPHTYGERSTTLLRKYGIGARSAAPRRARARPE